MESPWKIPLPLSEYTASRVVVYFYCNKWILIMSYPFEDALKLHRRMLLSGLEIYIFPPNLNPSDFQNSLN